MASSRGADIRNYIPALSKGAVIPLACLSAGFTTGISAKGITSAYIGDASIHNVMLSAKSVTSAKIRAAFLSGTIVSGQATRAVAHGLGVKPKFVVVAPLLTLAQAISGAGLQVALAAASAATTTNFYIIGSQPQNVAIKYVAYVQL
jgi:hypothetical protein